MAKAKVFNRHSQGLTHKEMFKGNMVEIPAGSFITMDYEEAVEFRSQYFPMKFGADEVQLPESYKMIEIVPEPTEAEETAVQKFVCQLDRKTFATQELLDEHIQKNYAHLIVKDESLDKELKTKKGKVA